MAQFKYEAMSHGGGLVTDAINADSQQDAADELRQRGLLVMRLEQAGKGDAGGDAPALGLKRGPRTQDILLFARQMKMLLESGTALVPALDAVSKPIQRPAFRSLIRSIHDHVEGGGTLTEVMRDHPDVFSPVFCSMIAAGEATATLPQSFDRLSTLTYRQRQTRKAVIGALLYPVVLCTMCIGVIGLMIGFVVPRFRMLFESLQTALPFSTEVMFAASDLLRAYWLVLVILFALALVIIIVTLRRPAIRQHLDPLLLSLPLVGHLLSRLQAGQVLRVWAALLRSNVPLLDAIEQSRGAASNQVFVSLLDKVRESISSGGSIGAVLADSEYVDPIIASAITTGEENGRLSEAVDFVSQWVDDENTQLVAGITRLVEPLMLAVMGVVVGLVAMSLFLPLFDIAAGAG